MGIVTVVRGMLATGRVTGKGALLAVLLVVAVPSASAAVIPDLDATQVDPGAPILPELDPKKLLAGGLEPVGDLAGTELPGTGGGGGALPPGGDGGGAGSGGGDFPGGASGDPATEGGGEAAAAGGGDASAAGGSSGSSDGGPGSGDGGGSGKGGGGGDERVRPDDLAAATLGPPATAASARSAKGDPAGELEEEGVSELVRIVSDIPTSLLVALVAVALTAIAFAVALLRERRRFKRAERDAMRDPLTGLANRLAFDHAIAIDWARAVRYERPLAVLMLDLDGLKRINDLRGHAAGDRALRATAAALTTRLRRGDVAARLSGDEFVVLTTETHGEGLANLAAELRGGLGQVPVDVSIGWAERTQGDTNFEQLLHRADMAMYEEKKTKRARTALTGVGVDTGNGSAGGNGSAANGSSANGSSANGSAGNGRSADSPLAGSSSG